MGRRPAFSVAQGPSLALRLCNGRCTMPSRFGHNQWMEDWSRKVHDIMDEMVKRRFVDFRDSGPWQPATNVYETRAAYHICVELAGMEREGIDVACTEGKRVTISGRRAQPRPCGEEGPLSIHVMEIDEGRFERQIDLPEAIVVERVEASYLQGYLWISLPKNRTT
jgi:HSP20 family protein